MTTLYTPEAEDLQVKTWQWDDHYDFPRNLVGYGSKSHNPQWPNGAKIAVSFVINYEHDAHSKLSALKADYMKERARKIVS